MLLSVVEGYLKTNRMPPARFGRAAVGDPCFVFDLRDGREPRPRTVARVLAFIDADKQAKASQIVPRESR